MLFGKFRWQYDVESLSTDKQTAAGSGDAVVSHDKISPDFLTYT